MPMWVKEAIDRWIVTAKVRQGRVFRAVSRHGTPWGKRHLRECHLVRGSQVC